MALLPYVILCFLVWYSINNILDLSSYKIEGNSFFCVLAIPEESQADKISNQLSIQD
jgi:hypothetical protein